LKQFDLKMARLQLGLSLDEMGQVLDTDRRAVSRYEASPDTKTHREPAVRIVRLVEAYLSGYRPPDWPNTGAQT